MIESLLTFFCGKNSQKKKKIRRILESIVYNPKTKEYICQSSRFPDNQYHIIYSNKSMCWKCDCEASLYKKYRLYETVDERNKFIDRNTCVHVTACKIKKTINLNNIQNNDIQSQ